MASNFSSYNSQKNQLPQYAYYTPALARHPPSQPYYYAQPAGAPQAMQQMHPRSRSFNDLYTPYYARQVPPSSYSLMFGQSPVAHGADHVPTFVRPPPGTPGNDVASETHSASNQPILSHSASTWSISNHSVSNQSISNQSISNQSISNQSTAPSPETPPASSSSGSKPLRYRGRMTRSKSHSMLLAPIDGNNMPLGLTPSANAPATVASPAPQPQGLTVGPQGRRMSSTSSIQRHKNYSASMSSTDGSSTPSIMSTADTDSLTTQTSLSSTSSVDDDARFQKGNHARRRSVVANVVPEGSDVSAAKLVENENEASDPNSKQDRKDPEIVINSQPNGPIKSGSEESVSNQTPQETSSDPAEVPSNSHVTARDPKEVSAPEVSTTEHSQTSTESVNKETALTAAVAAAAAATTASASTAAPSKIPVSKLPHKSNQPQASEASQAREASVKPARSAKEALPTKEVKSADTNNQASNEEMHKEEDTEVVSSKESPPLSRPKRATVAAPSKLVLPSDLQPRSYAQSNTASASSDSPTRNHSRSASWYTGTSASTPSSPAGSLTSGTADSLRPRTPSAQSKIPTQGDTSVFLRRSYASRQRPGVHSLPPRRPESYYGVAQQNPRHPLPRQPSASSSLSVASDAASEAASTASAGDSPPTAKSPAASSSHKVRSSRSFGSRLKGMFTKDKTNEQAADDSSETASITSTRSSKSTISTRSSSSGFSLPSRFRRKKTAAADAGPESFDIPSPPPPALTSQALRSTMPHLPSPPKSVSSLPVSSSSQTDPEVRPPSPALSSIGRQVAPNLTAGDIYPGLLRPNEVDTIISSLERTGSFERKPSTSRRSKEEKVPDERVIIAPEPSLHSNTTRSPLKSAMKGSSADTRPVKARHIAFAKNTLVYNTYSAADYNRTPEPLPYDLHDRRVIVQLYRELNDLKLSMPVHPSSKHHTQYLFDRETRLTRTPPI